MAPKQDQNRDPLDGASLPRCRTACARLPGVLALAALCLIGSSVNVSGDGVEAQPANDQPVSYTNNSGQQVLVFDNNLLDRRFGAQRPAPNKETLTNERAANEDSASASTNLAAALLDAPQRPPVPQSILAAGESFTALIATSRSAKTTVALRFAEKGRQKLMTGDPALALINFERALSLGVGAYVPYVYQYLAQAHSQLGHGDAAQDFTTAAQAWFDGDSGFAA